MEEEQESEGERKNRYKRTKSWQFDRYIYIYIYTRHHFLTIVMSRRIIRVNGATRKLSFVRDYYIKNLVDAISSSLKEFFNWRSYAVDFTARASRLLG